MQTISYEIHIQLSSPRNMPLIGSLKQRHNSSPVAQIKLDNGQVDAVRKYIFNITQKENI